MIEELVAWAQDCCVRPEAYFWRAHAGAEVDVLLAHGRRRVPIEIKLGAAVEPRALTGLRRCMEDLGLRRGFVVYSGTERRSVGATIEILPWSEIARGEIGLPL